DLSGSQVRTLRDLTDYLPLLSVEAQCQSFLNRSVQFHIKNPSVVMCLRSVISQLADASREMERTLRTPRAMTVSPIAARSPCTGHRRRRLKVRSASIALSTSGAHPACAGPSGAAGKGRAP